MANGLKMGRSLHHLQTSYKSDKTCKRKGCFYVKEKGAFTNEQEDFLGKVKLLLLSPSYLFGSHLFLYLNSVAFAFVSILSLYLNFGIIPLGIFIFYFLCSLEACKDFFFWTCSTLEEICALNPRLLYDHSKNLTLEGFS